MDLFARFEQTAASQPNKPAFIHFSSRANRWDVLTYQQLLDSTNRFILGLQTHRSNSDRPDVLSGGQARSLRPGMRAAVMTPPSVEFFPFALSLLKFGIIPIIVDPAIGLKKLGGCLKESQPDIFIGNTLTHALRILFGWGRGSIKHYLSIEKIKGQRSKGKFPIPNLQSPTPATPAAIIYTSGSTGPPKGVLYTHANFAAQLATLKDIFEISHDEIDLPAFPLYALMDVLLGVTSVIPDTSFPVPKDSNPMRILSAIQEYKVTSTFASPIVLDELAKYGVRKNIKLPSLKRVITAGAPATIQLQENFRKLLNDRTDLFGIYGATEVLPIAKIESREVIEIKNKSARGAGVCLGRPVRGVHVRIMRISDSAIEQWQDSLELGANVVGEITVQGEAVTRSYIAGEEANRLSKIKYSNDIIHRMGDVGYFDEQGRLWYCGRKSHRVVTKDGVLFTEQIEGIFNVHLLVYRTALVGVNKEPVLWIELEQNADKEKIKRELMDLAKDHAQASKIRTFLFMKEFPTDVRHNSKIIREKLTVIAEKRLA